MDYTSKMKAVLAFLLVAVACMVHVAFARVQWLGAKDAEAYDPVTGNKVSDMSHQLSFKISSQILFFEGDYSMKEFLVDPKDFMVEPHDPAWSYLPDLTNQTVTCPVNAGCAPIVVDMHATRIQFKYGQSVYIGCYGCMNKFRTAPLDYFDTDNLSN